MANFIWYKGEVPEGVTVKQVYGIMFTADGRIMIKIDPCWEGVETPGLAGGRPEDYDKDREATLRRELIEEVNTTIKYPVMLGYQTYFDGKEILPYVQVRMIALIDEIGPLQPDPDNGKTYKRLLTSPEKTIKVLNWDCGKEMIEDAVELAKKEYGIDKYNDIDEYV